MTGAARTGRGPDAAAPPKPRIALPFVALYVDESCLGNGREGDNPGGAAGVIEFVDRRERLSRWDYWISEPATTNNRMALRSAIEGFRVLSRKGRRFRVLFTSDSQYLVRGMTDWVFGWSARGWRRKGGPIENLELWKETVEAAYPHQVHWQSVRGHVGHPQNEYANDLAVRAAREQSNSGGVVSSGFEEWLTERRSKGQMAAEPAVFPTAATFRASRALPVVIRAPAEL